MLTKDIQVDDIVHFRNDKTKCLYRVTKVCPMWYKNRKYVILQKTANKYPSAYYGAAHELVLAEPELLL